MQRIFTTLTACAPLNRWLAAPSAALETGSAVYVRAARVEQRPTQLAHSVVLVAELAGRAVLRRAALLYVVL